MNRKKTNYRITCLAFLGICAGFSASSTPAGTTLLLPNFPLPINIAVTPNIFVEMDDSGSMDWDILTGAHFTACRYDNSLGCSTIEKSGVLYDYTGYYSNGNRIYRDFEYVLSSDDDAYNTGCTSGRQVLELCTNRDPDDFDWRARSSALNVVFYNPQVDYSPWPGYTDGSFSAARSYPDAALSGYSDVRNLNGFVYHHWIDDMGFSGTRPDRTDDTVGPNGIIDQWDSHVKVTVNASSTVCQLVGYAPDSSGLNRSTSSLSLTDSRCIEAMGVAGSTSELQANIANWYQYYRRRTMVARAAVATVLTELPNFRFGFGMINDQSVFVEMPDAGDIDFVSHNATVIDTFLKYQQLVAGTPLRRGLETVGEYYSGHLGQKPSPIIEACQKNFTLLFTDGFWNGGEPYGISTDVDGDGGVVFDNTNAETNTLLADVAKHYYDTDLSPLDDLVPTDHTNPASHQHMVTYPIGFGVTGSLSDTDDDGWPNDFSAKTHVGPWYLSGASDEEKRVDDLWHAAWNSKAKYTSAQRPEELIEKLGGVILSISNRIGSGASGSSNGGSIAANSRIFQSKYFGYDWHGELLAIDVDIATGNLDSVAWDAGNLLNNKPNSWFNDSAYGRQVYTINQATQSGLNFTWNSLTDDQRAALDKDPVSGVPDGEGEERLEYIRGSDANEETGLNFRFRDSKLGDLVHSDPEYVAAPPFFYPIDNYHDFAVAHLERTPMVYVGGNDGMLHAFEAASGEEKFAFVPNSLFHKMNKLTDPDYQHEFYVDGSAGYGDVLINDSWASILAGSLRSGGQAVYALDITDPDNFSTNDVLWEFSDTDDADLGYVFGEPQIKKMANGKWAVIFSSGYNNTEADGHASTTGSGYIFVLFIEDGLNGWNSSDYVKIELPNADGLSEPAVTDVDGDVITDFIYVGDLDGNLWKIDVTSENTLEWQVAFSGDPLFIAKNSDGIRQPITTRPAVMRHPLSIQNGVLVLFGTGKYLELIDDTNDGIPTQSVYSIWDRDGYYSRALGQRNNYGAHDFNRATDLANPELLVDVASGSRIINEASADVPIWYDVDHEPDSRGWFIDLPETGERVIRKVVLRDKLVFLVTLITAHDACTAGGTGWLMTLNAETGGAPRFPVLDITDDGVITVGDVITEEPSDPDDNPDITIPVGLEMLSIPNLPVFLYDDRPTDQNGVFPPVANSRRGCGSGNARTFTYTTRTNGSIQMITTANQTLSCGRQSWLQAH